MLFSNGNISGHYRFLYTYGRSCALFKTMYEQSYFEARLKGSRAQTKTICKKVASLESNWQPGSDRSALNNPLVYGDCQISCQSRRGSWSGKIGMRGVDFREFRPFLKCLIMLINLGHAIHSGFRCVTSHLISPIAFRLQNIYLVGHCHPSPANMPYVPDRTAQTLFPFHRSECQHEPPLYIRCARIYTLGDPANSIADLVLIFSFSHVPTSLLFLRTSTSTSSAYVIANAKEPKHRLCIDKLHWDAFRIGLGFMTRSGVGFRRLPSLALVLALANQIRMAELGLR